MPTVIPPANVQAGFLKSTVRHTRRVEIYESDGMTRWAGDTVQRLVGGDISVDYSREERRSVDLSLDNYDLGLRNEPGQFWYDKILKVYRGIRLDEKPRTPSVIIVSDANPEEERARAFRDMLVSIGYDDVRIDTSAELTLIDAMRYDVLVGFGPRTSNSDLLVDAFKAGKSVITGGRFSHGFLEMLSGTTIPVYDTGPGGAAFSDPVAPTGTHPAALGWSAFTDNRHHDTSGYTFVPGPAFVQSVWGNRLTSITTELVSGLRYAYTLERTGKAYMLQWEPSDAVLGEAGAKAMFLSALSWLAPPTRVIEWEVQVGEFMIDRITEGNMPHTMTITGRDYTKKCIGSRFLQATQFASGQKFEDLVRAIAVGAGILSEKMILPNSGITVTRSFLFERGVTRWEALKEITNAYNHEIYFDAEGYLVVRPYGDPATDPVVFTFSVDSRDSNVANYEKSTSDTRIYNIIQVTCESSEEGVMPFGSTAINDDPTSPTSVAKIGPRTYEYVSSFFTNVSQTQAYADKLLQDHALEEYEINFGSFMLPWLEAGDIVGWNDPHAPSDDPDRFLLSSLTIPLALGPMSSVAKRVIKVGA